MVSSDSGRLIAKFNWSLASGKSTLTSPPKELLDATNHSEGAPLEGKSRGDASERLRQAHEAAGHDKWFREQVELAVKEADAPGAQWVSADDAKASWKQKRAELLNRADGGA